MTEETKNTELAVTILRETVHIEGTPVATYLMYHRIPSNPCLRCCGSMAHPEGGNWPVMIAPVTDSNGDPVAIHMTFLTHDGKQKAPVRNKKLVIGSAEGNAVRLASSEENFVIIGVDLEVCLRATRYARKPIWATLSLKGLEALKLPQEVSDVTVLTALGLLSLQSAHVLRDRCTQEGRTCRVRTLIPSDFEYHFFPEEYSRD